MPEVVETVAAHHLVERVPDLETITTKGDREEIFLSQGETLQVGIAGATEVIAVPEPELLEREVSRLELLESIGIQELVEVSRQGPPGPAGAASVPVSRALIWSAGRLVGVTYADGRSKALTWAGDRLTRVDTLRPGLPTLRADLSYNPDGTLAAVAQSEV